MVDVSWTALLAREVLNWRVLQRVKVSGNPPHCAPFRDGNIPAECAAIDSSHGDAESTRLEHVMVVEAVNKLMRS